MLNGERQKARKQQSTAASNRDMSQPALEGIGIVLQGNFDTNDVVVRSLASPFASQPVSLSFLTPLLSGPRWQR